MHYSQQNQVLQEPLLFAHCSVIRFNTQTIFILCLSGKDRDSRATSLSN